MPSEFNQPHFPAPRLLSHALRILPAASALVLPFFSQAELIDITRLGHPSQSTEWNGGLYPAGLAVDGNSSTFSHTDLNSLANRWELSFDNRYRVVEIRITARADCCGGRLTGSTLRILGSEGQTLHTEPVRDPGPGEELRFQLPGGLDAILIRIGFEGFASNPESNRVLHLAEVTVLAEVQTGPEILAFSAAPVFIDAGASTTLRWEAPGAHEVTIKHSEGVWSLPASGEWVYQPVASSELILEARDGSGVTRATLAVIVDGVLLAPGLTEFMTANASFLTDTQGAYPDWIEVRNPNPVPLSLEGYGLTDDPEAPRRWIFPPKTLDPGEFALFFSASGSGSGAALDRFPFGLSSDAGSYLALTRPDGETLSAFLDYPGQHDNISYGLGPDQQPAFFLRPTPGEPNERGISGFLTSPGFSRAGSFADAAFELELTTAEAGTGILYTVDASWPEAGHPSTRVYEAPIRILTSTIVRARTTSPGLADSPVVSHTYLFLDHILDQPQLPEGFPANWGDGPGITAPMPAKSDYAMDPRVVNSGPWTDAAGENFTMHDALRSIPTLALGIDAMELFHPATGIHAQALHKGRSWERRISLEYFDPAGDRGFGVDAGVRMQGGWNRHPESLKKSFRLYFRRDYGTAKLDFPLFSDSSERRFDSLVLRAGNGKAWSSPWRPLTGSTNNSLERTQYLRDQFLRDSQRDMGQPSSHGTFVHLYINGLYWGLYNLVERIDENFAVSWFGGQKEDYDVLKWIRAEGGIQANEGSLAQWNRALAVLRSNPASLETWIALHDLIDLANLADYMLVNFYAGNTDWPDSNAYTLGAPLHGRPFRFFCWDSEETLVSVNVDRTGIGDANTSAEFYSRLRANPEFRVLLGDRIEKHLRDDGALASEAADRRWMGLAAVIDRAIVAESARWGDLMRPSRPYTREDWLNEQQNIRQNYLGTGGGTSRTSLTLSHLQSAGLVPRLRSPVASIPPGQVPPGTTLEVGLRSIFAPGEVYYTLDGSDPRLPGGAIHPEALSGRIPLFVEGDLHLLARVYHSSDWSPILEARYYSGRVPRPRDLVISEIMYHPAGDGAAEYLELLNTTSDSLLLDGLQFDSGIQFVFSSGTVLQPGARVLLVHDRQAMATVYGPALPILGTFEDDTRLSNSGELVRLVSADGSAVLDAVDFGDAEPWPSAADGKGYSLTRRDPAAAGPAAWRLSVQAGGSPGGSDSEVFHGEPLADRDNNGIADLVDHALGQAPGLRLRSWPNPAAAGTVHTFSFRRRLAADDATVVLEISDDNQTWRLAGPDWVLRHEEPLADGAVLTTYTQEVLAPSPSLFLRLRIAARHGTRPQS
ncbi:MAG TPA: CotH kinase family protein [Verrucomicrobiales bacterium]|nr:CotH kinase family protein [Verrucomicrobiales bacterium]